MRHNAASRIERVRQRVVEQIADVRRVDVGEAEQPTREIRGIVVGAENAAELLVEHHFGGQPEFVAFAVPAGECGDAVGRLVVLVVLDHLGEHLQPVGVALELGIVERVDFVLEFIQTSLLLLL